MKTTLTLLSALFLTSLLPLTAAELKLASVLADHMVLCNATNRSPCGAGRMRVNP
jgi:hypothetical protein